MTVLNSVIEIKIIKTRLETNHCKYVCWAQI